MDPSSNGPHTPPVSHPLLTDDERVDQAGWGSFPASDPPPWTSGPERHPHQDDGPEGGDDRERGRRRRQLDD